MSVPALPGRLVLLGHPVGHSLSPRFQGAALAEAGIDLAYEALDVTSAQLPRVLRELRASGAAGNVTIPHKLAMFAACDEVTGVARRAGAVNTFWHTEGRLVGDNTDVEGFTLAAGTLGTRREGAVVALLGAGGAAAAICVAVAAWTGASVRVLARNAARAGALAARFPGVARVVTSVEEALRGATLVVNATPVGLQDDALPVAVESIPRYADVMDLVYRAGETPWVRTARARGLRAMDGREMLLQQGAAAFSRWFKRPPNLAAMRAALDHLE